MEFVCKKCGIKFTNRHKRQFCCRECYIDFIHNDNYIKYLEDNSIAWGYQNMQNYKKFFLAEQEYKCAICGLPNIWNDKELVFILDHIDGNANNNNRDNLRLVCPNCDSQLSTYKSKNKESARRKYRK